MLTHRLPHSAKPPSRILPQRGRNMAEEMRREQIGSVTLDLSHYPGEDLYCDGEVEDRILEIAKSHPEEEFDAIIREAKDWPTLYHLSSIRGNIVGWIPFAGNEKVLEIGAGPGAITGVLTGRCGQVDCVDLSRKRSLINAYRHRDCGNLTIHVGNFEDVEPELDRDYDYVFLIGVLEYAESYLHAKDPFGEELRTVFSHLKPGGRVVIAIENRLGLKYWAGCAEDHSGRFFGGIESYSGENEPAKTFTRPALEQLLLQNGATEYSFYYPYPDYKFTSVLYSDRRLPEAGELNENIRNFDRDRLLLFDEKKAYQGITQDGLYPMFANSFEVVVGPALPVDYCKFSNDRAPEYRIRTELDLIGGRVRKYPQTRAAEEHIRRMADSAAQLAARYAVTGWTGEGHPKLPEMNRKKEEKEMQETAQVPKTLRIAPCVLTADGGVEFPYVSGRPLESLLDESLQEGDGERFLGLLNEYRERVGQGSLRQISDYDMTFSNLLVDGEIWTAIDYEWAVPRSIPVEELLFRSLLVYYLEDEKRSERCEELIGSERLLQTIGVPEKDANRLAMEEQNFQNQVTGGIISLGELRAQMGTQVIKPAELQTKEEKEAAQEALQKARKEEERSLTSIQVYFDTGRGFSEEESYWVSEHYEEEGMVTFTVSVPAEARTLRVDPAICPCMVMIREAGAGNADRRTISRLARANGRRYTNGSIVYTTMDPSLEWDLKKLRKKAGIPEGEDFDLELTLQMVGLPSTMAKAMEERG